MKELRFHNAMCTRHRRGTEARDSGGRRTFVAHRPVQSSPARPSVPKVSHVTQVRKSKVDTVSNVSERQTYSSVTRRDMLGMHKEPEAKRNKHFVCVPDIEHPLAVVVRRDAAQEHRSWTESDGTHATTWEL